MRYPIRKFFAFITGKRLIWLRDSWENEYISYAYKNPSGNGYSSYVYYFTRVGPIALYPEGRVEGSMYIKEWGFIE